MKVHIKKNQANTQKYIDKIKNAEIVEYETAWNRINFNSNKPSDTLESRGEQQKPKFKFN